MQNKTINDVLKSAYDNVLPSMRHCKYIGESKHDKNMLYHLFEKLGRPSFARCNTHVLLDYIEYRICRDNAVPFADIKFSECFFCPGADWANMSVDEIRESQDIHPDIKNELINIIENSIYESFNFTW